MRSISCLLIAFMVFVGCDDAAETRADAEPIVSDAARADGPDPTPGDGAVVDSGPLDATTLDATALDATMFDATTLDATTLDATTRDGGAGPEPDAGRAPTGDGCAIPALLEQRCANGGCHLPENRRTGLVLTREAIAGGSLAGYVVPFEPESSYLIDRMSGRGAGPLMPLGSVAPIDELPLVEAWVADGAPTACDGPIAAPPSDPNHLDPDVLFTCDDPRAGATPARVRRVERREWTRAVVKPLAGTWWGSTAKDNPFAAPEGLPYSTYPADVTIDPATLDLYMLVLPEAPAIWNARDPRAAPGFLPGERTAVVYNNRPLWCIFNDAAPSDDCLDLYVRTLLRDGVLFRAPTDGEFGRLRAFLVDALAAEVSPAARRATLQHVGEAAFLMAGALFRSEVGEPALDPDDPGAPPDPTRRRLTADELALAVGRVLSAHPVGAPLPIAYAGQPDAQAPLRGRLGLIRAAAEDGSIFDPAVVSGLLEAYRGGVDAARPDLAGEEDARGIPARGDYWLAENIAQFFREWLDYGGANTAFKDTPGATSRWDGSHRGDPMYDPSTVGYRILQNGAPGYESTLVDQLDDTIARAVIESHEQGDDVFARLMTTRTWRLPSNVAELSDIPCAVNADCPSRDVSPYFVCHARGVCGSSISGNSVHNNRVYGIDGDVAASDEGRWVEMPAAERSGVLTHPAWLSAHGGNFEDDASIVHRGRWIRERLFCETVPGLEFVQAEAKLIPSDPAHSARERVRRSIEDPAENPQSPICMGCHTLMNSLGRPFEVYTHAGFVRAFDHGPEGPVAPDGTSRIERAPEPSLAVEVRDAVEFSALLSRSRVARRCFIRQTFRYFSGRDETAADACVLAEMEAALDRDGSFFSMLDALVAHDSFQARSLPAEDAP